MLGPDTRKTINLEPFDSAYLQLHDATHSLADATVLDWPTQKCIPIFEKTDGQRVLLVLRMFSGRRRKGDCHDWAHQLVKEYFPDLEVLFLSIDTAVGGDLCELLRGPGLLALHEVVDAGAVAGNLSGPPCETWSAARHLPPPDDTGRRWPRPLRSSQRPWGLDYLTHRELRQLATGSALMLSNVFIEVKIVLHGGACPLEHPAPHAQEEYASVWRTVLQRLLCAAAPQAKQVHIQQWKYTVQMLSNRQWFEPWASQVQQRLCIAMLFQT